MTVESKKLAIIGAAVSAYLEAERVEQAAICPEPAIPPGALRLWSQAGRQDIMRHRQMWQLRLVSR